MEQGDQTSAFPAAAPASQSLDQPGRAATPLVAVVRVMDEHPVRLLLESRGEICRAPCRQCSGFDKRRAHSEPFGKGSSESQCATSQPLVGGGQVGDDLHDSSGLNHGATPERSARASRQKMWRTPPT